MGSETGKEKLRKRFGLPSTISNPSYFPDRNRRVVILSQVLPANSTIGYDELALFDRNESERQRDQIVRTTLAEAVN